MGKSKKNKSRKDNNTEQKRSSGDAAVVGESQKSPKTHVEDSGGKDTSSSKNKQLKEPQTSNYPDNSFKNVERTDSRSRRSDPLPYTRSDDNYEQKGKNLRHSANDAVRDRRSDGYRSTEISYKRDAAIRKELRAEFDWFEGEFDTNKKPEFTTVFEMQQDLFAMPKDYSLAHCVAEDFNMGSGIAVQFRREFKRVDELLNQRQEAGGLAVLDDDDRFIYYLVTKRYSSGKPTYFNLFCSLKKMLEHVTKNDVTKIAMPRIGCGLDRLDWPKVKYMLEYLFREQKIEILICNLQLTEDSPSQQKHRNSRVTNVFYPIEKIEEQTVIIYFSTEDGYITEEMKALNEKFNFLQEFRYARRTNGSVICTTKNKNYLLCGCIVKKRNADSIDFAALQSCLRQIQKTNNKSYGFEYVGFQVINPDHNNDFMINYKIINLLRNTLRDVEIYLCWPGVLKDYMSPMDKSLVNSSLNSSTGENSFMQDCGSQNNSRDSWRQNSYKLKESRRDNWNNSLTSPLDWRDSSNTQDLSTSSNQNEGNWDLSISSCELKWDENVSSTSNTEIDWFETTENNASSSQPNENLVESKNFRSGKTDRSTSYNTRSSWLSTNIIEQETETEEHQETQNVTGNDTSLNRPTANWNQSKDRRPRKNEKSYKSHTRDVWHSKETDECRRKSKNDYGGVYEIQGTGHDEVQDDSANQFCNTSSKNVDDCASKKYEKYLKQNKSNKEKQLWVERTHETNLYKDHSRVCFVSEDMTPLAGTSIGINIGEPLGKLLNQEQKVGGLAVVPFGSKNFYCLVVKRFQNSTPSPIDIFSSILKLRLKVLERNERNLVVVDVEQTTDKTFDWSEIKYYISFIFESGYKIFFTHFKQEVPKASNRLLHVKSGLHQSKIQSCIIYLASENGIASAEMLSLNRSFPFIEEFNNSEKCKGKVISCHVNSDYTTCGCIVKNLLSDPIDFVALQKCISIINVLNKDRKLPNVSVQAVRDEDDTTTFKIINILLAHLQGVTIHVCWPGDLRQKMPSNN